MSVERMQLPDGRAFEYSASGDPGGELLVLFVGTPSAVVDFPYLARAAAARGLRSVICSRPGYGGSTRNEGRTVADAASDTAALADHLGAERFLVAGWSGGGSSALACAALLPDRVRAAVTLAGLAPPVEAGEVWTTWFSGDMVDEIRALPRKPPAERETEYRQAAQSFAELTGEQLQVSENQSAADKAALIELPEVAEWLARSLQSSVSAGIWGWMDDDLAWARPWGFDVADIRVPVVIRHGDEDGFVSIEQGRWLAAHIPGAQFDEMPGGGHTTVGVPIDPVITALLDAAGPR
ncbi:MAG TPA: alpha/beta hydrolase [Gaiellales bacterium]|nr:alpha/beta hydrolase [Gaiellales bacterium]